MTVLLVRHPPVARHWAKKCYGISEAPLARGWRTTVDALAAQCRAHGIAQIVHSGLARSQRPAAAIADALGVPIIADADWGERDFGAWEGRSWHAIWRETGNAMDGMTRAPAQFRPGGNGETTFALRDRVMRAFDRLPAGNVAVITHGGPIAAILGARANLPVERWPALVPATGQAVLVARR